MYNSINVDFENLPEYVTIPYKQLKLNKVALGLINLPAGKGYTFTHSHDEQEEVYICLKGTGTALIGNDKVSLKKGDILRIDPEDRRAFLAGEDEPLVMICAGGVTLGYPKNENSRSLIDDGIPHFDDIPYWYEGNEKVKTLVEKIRQKRESENI